MHSDVLILKSWFAMHRMLQGCATNPVRFSPTGCSSWGLSRPVSESESERQRARNVASESERDFYRERATIHNERVAASEV